jgi:hypothetical protein
LDWYKEVHFMRATSLMVLWAGLAASACGNHDACSLVGTWTGTDPHNGAAETVTFAADGTFAQSEGAVAGATGNWKVDGTVLTLTDPSCGVSVAGTYTVLASSDCATMEAELIMDACQPRANAISGAFQRH